MESVVEGTARDRSSTGPGTGDRVAALTEAVELATGRVDAEVLERAGSAATRAEGRLRLSEEHTVVAIAGATGSGKSSTFNALTGLDLAATGVRRPTTSWATACVWGSVDVTALLDWLGIPPRHQTRRDSMLDRDRDGHDLDGVVLLDLPDHDSTEVSHHLEVDRLVEKTDLMVWVLDPQKYADAAVHERYLRPLAAHADTMVVVLNHLDVVPEGRRESMLDDVRRLLADDGLPGVPVVGVSARQGWGIDELRSRVAERVADKRLARSRVDLDVRAAAEELATAAGVADVGATTPRTLSDARVERLDDDLAQAAGVPVVVEAVEVTARRRAARATGWPLLAWTGLLSRDPVARGDVDLGGDVELARDLTARSAIPEAHGVERARVDAAVRSLADDVSEGLPAAWRESVRRASSAHRDELADGLDTALARTDLEATRLPAWVRLVQVAQWLLLLTAVGGGVWFGLAAAGTVTDVDLGGVPLGLVLLVGGLVLGLVLSLVARTLVGGAGRFRADVADRVLRTAIHDVAAERVVAPTRAELTAHGALSSALDRARA